MTRAQLGATQSGGGAPHQDDDLDGLDNALEKRLGLLASVADSDADLADDLIEILLGTDPHTANTPSSFPDPLPSASLESYVAGSSFVLQSAILRKNSIDALHFYAARKNPRAGQPGQPDLLTARLGQRVMSQYLASTETIPLTGTKYEIQRFRHVLPAAVFVQMGEFAIAVVAEVDHGVKVADEIRYTNSSNFLLEWRANECAASTSDGSQGAGSTGQGGGLFPADPFAGPPIGENLVNQVCVQELSAAGLTGVGLLYSITDAYCDSLVGAVCLASCTSTSGGTVVGLDLPSLLQ